MTREKLMAEWKSLYTKSQQALENARTAERMGDQETADSEYLTYELCTEHMEVLDERMSELD